MAKRSWARFRLEGCRRTAGWLTMASVLAAFLSSAPSLSLARSPATAANPAARAENPKLLEELAAVRGELERASERDRALATALAEAREALGPLQQRLSDLEAEVRGAREGQHNAQEQLRDLREEVRGLYVESSGLKGDIAQLSDKLDTVADELAGFRLSAGILAALVLLLQGVAIALLLRGPRS